MLPWIFHFFLAGTGKQEQKQGSQDETLKYNDEHGSYIQRGLHGKEKGNKYSLFLNHFLHEKKKKLPICLIYSRSFLPLSAKCTSSLVQKKKEKKGTLCCGRLNKCKILWPIQERETKKHGYGWVPWVTIDVWEKEDHKSNKHTRLGETSPFGSSLEQEWWLPTLENSLTTLERYLFKIYVT